MSKIVKEEVYQRAIKMYGIYGQCDVCIEECSELIQAISKFKRRSRKNNIWFN